MITAAMNPFQQGKKIYEKPFKKPFDRIRSSRVIFWRHVPIFCKARLRG